MDGSVWAQIFGADGWVVGEEEDAAGARPKLVEGFFCLEDGWGVRPEAAEPEAIKAAVDEMDLLARVEDQSGAGGEFSINDDEVVGARLGLACLIDRFSQAFGTEDGIEADQALVCG